MPEIEESESQEDITPEVETAENPPAEGEFDGDDSQPESPEESRGPRDEDYKKGMFKYKKLYEDLKRNPAGLETSVPSKPSSTPTDVPENSEALQILGNLIDQRLAPLKGALEKQGEMDAVREVMSMKYSSALEPEIMASFKDTPESLPFGDRLKMARSMAIAENVDKIAKVSRELGAEEAYQNKGTKKTLKTPNTPARTTPGGSTGWRDKLENGEALSSAEYMANRAEILEWEKTQTKTLK